MRFDFCSSKSEFTFMNFLIKHFHPVKAFLYLYDHFGFLYETVGFCSHSVSFFFISFIHVQLILTCDWRGALSESCSTHTVHENDTDDESSRLINVCRSHWTLESKFFIKNSRMRH